MARLSPAYYLLDGTVPRSKLASTLLDIDRVCDELGLQVSHVFHAGDGNLHPFILIDDLTDPELINRVNQAGRDVMGICIKYGGSLTGEHGIGVEKRKFMSMMYNPDELSIMRDVKDVFDPNNLLNPGKILPKETTGVIKNTFPKPKNHFISPVSPSSKEEVIDMIAACLYSKQSLRLQGGGTKSALLPPASFTISTCNLQGIHTCAIADYYVRAGAGTRIGDLQEELAQHNVWVPIISPWKESTLGGIIATNFNAPLRMHYGGLRDLLLAASVVLPDGRAIQTGRPVVKNVAGYDLPKLFVGSHGTLGLIMDVTLKLAPLPRFHESLIIQLNSLKLALEIARQLLPVCMNATSLLLAHRVEEFSTASYSLVFTVEGLKEDVEAEIKEARSTLNANVLSDVYQSNVFIGGEAWAKWIKAATEMEHSLWRVGVAPKDLPNFIDHQLSGIDGPLFVADVASGLVYVQDPRDPLSLTTAANKAEGYAVLLSAKLPLPDVVNAWGYKPSSFELMSKLKSKWDPGGFFNPRGFIL